jgi:hypothetical protein
VRNSQQSSKLRPGLSVRVDHRLSPHWCRGLVLAACSFPVLALLPGVLFLGRHTLQYRGRHGTLAVLIYTHYGRAVNGVSS